MRTVAVVASIARIHIVAIGALGPLTFAFALCGASPTAAWPLAVVSACDWFVVNLLNRVVDLKEDAANQITGTAVVARHQRLVVVIGVGALVASLALTIAVAPWLTPFRVAFHALGFAYNWPVLPRRRRIKELAFWKNTASATGFLLTVFAYPLATFAEKNDVSPSTIACAAAFFFLFELSYEVLYDLRDVDGDRVARVSTWPVLFGVAAGWRIAFGLMLASFVVDVGAFAFGVLPWRIAVMGAAPPLQLVCALRIRRRPITTADCIGITWLGCALGTARAAFTSFRIAVASG